eukprot:scaffold287535_cov36-Prasinocladus_malaysianus.AAC.1
MMLWASTDKTVYTVNYGPFLLALANHHVARNLTYGDISTLIKVLDLDLHDMPWWFAFFNIRATWSLAIANLVK